MRRLYREGAAACFLEVNEANAAAVRLYRSLGFEVVGKRKGYYRAGQAPARAPRLSCGCNSVKRGKRPLGLSV